LINQPIQVTAVSNSDGLVPSSFIWRGSQYRLEAIRDSWEETGRWLEQEAPVTA